MDRESYLYALRDENFAGEFLGLKPRTLQALRQRGGGPRFVRISRRAVKYRIVDLQQWAESKLVSSTAEASGR